MTKEAAATKLPAVQLKPLDAVKRIEKDYPQEAKLLLAVVENNILALGTDEVFALRDKEGEVRAFKQICQLSLVNGGLVNLPIAGGVIIVSAQGYEMWAEKAAASVIFPVEVMVYGKPMANPAALHDANGDWTGWAIRAAAFRLSAMGLPIVSDRTVIFDINNRRNIEFLAKAKKYQQAFKILAKKANPPEENGSWIEYEFDKASSLWVNASHNEALDWYADISQMIKNSLQLAQTHAARNALKHLSGLQKAPDKTGVWNIPVIAWRPTSGNIIKWDPTTYKNLQTKISAMVSGDRSEFKQIELTSGVDTLDETDIAAVNAGEVDETAHAAGAEGEHKEEGAAQEPKEKKKARPKEDQKVIQQLRAVIKSMPDEFAKACFALELKELEADQYEVDTAKKIMEKVTELMEA
jgi:hypothetical protein